MSHSYAQNHIHLVFSTKNREKILAAIFYPACGHTRRPSAKIMIC